MNYGWYIEVGSECPLRINGPWILDEYCALSVWLTHGSWTMSSPSLGDNTEPLAPSKFSGGMTASGMSGAGGTHIQFCRRQEAVTVCACFCDRNYHARRELGRHCRL